MDSPGVSQMDGPGPEDTLQVSLLQTQEELREESAQPPRPVWGKEQGGPGAWSSLGCCL